MLYDVYIMHKHIHGTKIDVFKTDFKKCLLKKTLTNLPYLNTLT